jgi:hypothetical protein
MCDVVYVGFEFVWDSCCATEFQNIVHVFVDEHKARCWADEPWPDGVNGRTVMPFKVIE